MKAGIIANRDKDAGLNVSGKICRLFRDNGVDCFICDQIKRGEFNYTDPVTLPKDIDFIITVGGDGTLIQAARDLCKLSLPIIGVNMGRLGFLAELDTDGLLPAVLRLCRKDFFIEEHMMLNGQVLRSGQAVYKNFSLNDVVISKYGHSHIIQFDVYADGQLLCDYNADGLIMATPTGSTAYNLSAGGPLVFPGARMMVMTPICAHALYSRSVCLPESSTVKIHIKEKNPGAAGCAAIFDGAATFELCADDEIILTKSDEVVKLIKLDHTSFFKVLQKKMS